MCVLRPQAIFLTVVVYITLLLFGRDSGAALQTDTEERLSTRWTFRASVETTHTEAGKDANPSSRSTFEYATSESKLAVWQTEALPDGRHTEELQRFPYADRPAFSWRMRWLLDLRRRAPIHQLRCCLLVLARGHRNDWNVGGASGIFFGWRSSVEHNSHKE